LGEQITAEPLVLWEQITAEPSVFWDMVVTYYGIH